MRNNIEFVVANIDISAAHIANKTTDKHRVICVGVVICVVWRVREDRLLTFFSIQFAVVIAIFTCFNGVLKFVFISCVNRKQTTIVFSNQTASIKISGDDVRRPFQVHISVEFNSSVVDECGISDIAKKSARNATIDVNRVFHMNSDNVEVAHLQSLVKFDIVAVELVIDVDITCNCTRIRDARNFAFQNVVSFNKFSQRLTNKAVIFIKFLTVVRRINFDVSDIYVMHFALAKNHADNATNNIASKHVGVDRTLIPDRRNID